MKIKDIPIFKQKVLDVLPIAQSEVKNILGIDHRDVSKLIGIMICEHLIKKTKFDRTFLLEKNGSGVHKKITYSDVLLSKDKFSPCCGCDLECDPSYCSKLSEWIMGINSDDKKEDINGDDKKEDIKGDDKKEDKKEDIKGDDKKEEDIKVEEDAISP